MGSVIALLFGGLSAVVPGLAYITVYTNWSNILLTSQPQFTTFPLTTFGLHDLTIKLVVTAFGGLLGLCSIACEHKSTVPFLSFAGLSLGTIGFLLPYGSNQAFSNEFFVNVPWVGSLIALVGVMLMFTGFALRNANVPKKALTVIPVLLMVYLLSPALIFTGNLELFILLQINITISTTIGIVLLMGHLIIVWAGITGLHTQETDSQNNITHIEI